MQFPVLLKTCQCLICVPWEAWQVPATSQWLNFRNLMVKITKNKYQSYLVVTYAIRQKDLSRVYPNPSHPLLSPTRVEIFHKKVVGFRERNEYKFLPWSWIFSHTVCAWVGNNSSVKFASAKRPMKIIKLQIRQFHST